MIEINGVQLRNLEEQVQKNKEDIAAHYNVDRVLADFGIRIIGQVANSSDLPDPQTFAGYFGDAYAVGLVEPYRFYIWTRADVNSGHPNNYWMDIGPLSILGPQGPQGPEGPQGPQGESSTIYTYNALGGPEGSISDAKINDIAINTGSGQLWQATSNGWVLKGNIRGPQGVTGPRGIQGPQGIRGPIGPAGPAGPQGKSYKIVGILSNIDLLPSPEEMTDMQDAYLIGTNPYNLYILIGEDLQTAIWTNVGPFNTGTAVIQNGSFTPEWDADTKVDKLDSANAVYGTDGDMNLKAYPTSLGTGIDSVIVTSPDGYMYVNTPIENLNPVNLQYLSNALRNYQSKLPFKVNNFLTINEDDEVVNVECSAGLKPFTVPRRDINNTFRIGNPTNDAHPATKSYVDNAVANKLDYLNIPNAIYANDDTGSPDTLGYAYGNEPSHIVSCDGEGYIHILEPTQSDNPATKKYVDDNINPKQIRMAYYNSTILGMPTFTQQEANVSYSDNSFNVSNMQTSNMIGVAGFIQWRYKLMDQPSTIWITNTSKINELLFNKNEYDSTGQLLAWGGISIEDNGRMYSTSIDLENLPYYFYIHISFLGGTIKFEDPTLRIYLTDGTTETHTLPSSDFEITSIYIKNAYYS